MPRQSSISRSQEYIVTVPVTFTYSTYYDIVDWPGEVWDTDEPTSEEIGNDFDEHFGTLLTWISELKQAEKCIEEGRTEEAKSRIIRLRRRFEDFDEYERGEVEFERV